MVTRKAKVETGRASAAAAHTRGLRSRPAISLAFVLLIVAVIANWTELAPALLAWRAP